MKAVVQDRYGPPEILQIEEIERPVPKANEALVKVYATTVTRSDCGVRGSHPFWGACSTAFSARRRGSPGPNWPGLSMRSGPRSQSLPSATRCSACARARTREYVCVPEQGALARQAREPELRRGSGDLRRRDHRGHLPPQGGPAGGPAHSHLRRLRIHRHRGGAACQALRGARHRDLQHEERRAHALPRSRRRRGLHAGGLHEERRDVRSRVRRGGKHSFRRSRRSLEAGGTFVETDLGFV